jgi:hypothetical protein
MEKVKILQEVGLRNAEGFDYVKQAKSKILQSITGVMLVEESIASVMKHWTSYFLFKPKAPVRLKN